MAVMSDREDQHWLDTEVAGIVSDFDDVKQHVANISENWTAGRNLSRLHPGSAIEYIVARLADFGFAFKRTDVPWLVADTNLSARQIAKATGVDRRTVDREAKRQVGQNAPPAPRLGADNKTYRPPSRATLTEDEKAERRAQRASTRAARASIRATQERMHANNNSPTPVASVITTVSQAEGWARFLNRMQNDLSWFLTCGDPTIEAKADAVRQCLDAQK